MVPPVVPLSPGHGRALIEWAGFPDGGSHHDLLVADGSPTAVAQLLARALEHCSKEGDPPAALPKHLPIPAISGWGAMDPGYRYLLRLVSSKRQRLTVACWRRYPGAWGWQRRFEPMALERFLQRFLDPDGDDARTLRPRGFSRSGANSRGASS